MCVYGAGQGARACGQERGEGSPRYWRSKQLLPSVGGSGAPVAESALAPPGPIPNPVVTQRSAGEYCGGDPTGGEAAAGAPGPRDTTEGRAAPTKIRSPRTRTAAPVRRGVEQRQL